MKPAKREETLESIAFTLNHIWLQDHQVNSALKYAEQSEEDMQMPMAAEEGEKSIALRYDERDEEGLALH